MWGETMKPLSKNFMKNYIDKVWVRIRYKIKFVRYTGKFVC